MITSFDITKGPVLAEVVKVMDKYLFARNGEDIFCDHRRGGSLEVSAEGRLAFNPNGLKRLPVIGEQVVILRESDHYMTRDFTKAAQWVNMGRLNWTHDSSTVFRAVAHDHRIDSQTQHNNEITLIEDTLLNITIMRPRKHIGDPLAKCIYSQLGGKTFSSKVRWDQRLPDGSYKKLVVDPRPKKV